MPNENNTNQINSGDIGNFPDTALGQENHTHHSPAVREEAIHETLFPGKIVAQGSIDRTGNGDDDAAGDERFALDA